MVVFMRPTVRPTFAKNLRCVCGNPPTGSVVIRPTVRPTFAKIYVKNAETLFPKIYVRNADSVKMCMPRYICPAILRTKKLGEQKDSEEEER